MKATVLVRPKQGILDPQGEAVLGSLRKLGFDVDGVRVGRVIDVELATDDVVAARSQLERMCSELLANPLIESYDVELGPALGASGSGLGDEVPEDRGGAGSRPPGPAGDDDRGPSGAAAAGPVA